MNLLVIKLTIVPSVIALITLVARKWGNKLGGLIGSMPWTAGPILLFFILEQGKTFGIESIQGVMTGILALIVFCFSYASLSRKLTWLPTLLLSYSLYFVIALAINSFRLNVYISYTIAIVSILLALRFFPTPTNQAVTVRRMPLDIPIRMGVATLFVLVITGLASVLGPKWSGILTPFPIMTSVLAIFSHMLQGSHATITTLRGLVIGLLGFTTFLFLQAFLLPHFSIAISFGVALLVNTIINLIANRVW